MKPIVALSALILTSVAVAQDYDAKPSKESLAYSEYRIKNVEPPYGLAKIKAMVAKVKEDEDMNRRLSQKQFDSLSFKEKFTYTMIHGEDFDQNCADFPPILDEHKKIFAHFPGNFEYQGTWSKRQLDFLTRNRTAVIGLIRTNMLAKNRVGVTFKNAIWNLNAVELVPDLVSIYRRDHKDKDILSLMINLMNDHKYKPFLSSPIHQALFGKEDNWMSFVPASSANEKAILSMAQSFSKLRKK